jgi:hypothetical protein
MYNFKKNAKAYIVYYDTVAAAYKRYQVEIYNDITASQTFDEQSYKQKTLHSLTSLHDKAVVNNANPANFQFTTPILNVATVPIFLNLGSDYSTGNLVSFDLYIQSDYIIYKIEKCIIESMAFNIERNSILTVSISGTAIKISKFGNVGSVTIPGTVVTDVSKSYIAVDRLSVSVDGTLLENIPSINIDLKNDVAWTPNNTVNEAVTGTIMYPGSYILQGRTFSGSITQFITTVNVDTLTDTSTSAPIIIGIYSSGYQSATAPIIQFNLPSTVFTRRLNFEELINRVYDFRLNTNSTIVKPLYKGA